MHIVREWEKRITRTRHSIQFRCPFLPLRLAQWCDGLFEKALPLCLFSSFQNLTRNIQIDSVGFFWPFYSLLERKSKDTRVMTEPPQVSLATSQSCAMNARLLACADADDSAVVCVRDAVGLCVF
jgi:hypothetical protein